MKPLGRVRVPGLGAGISVGIRPLVQQSADEPLHLPVHPWRIERRGPMPDAQPSEHPLETLGLEDFGMIRHHRLNTDAHPAVVAQRGKQKGHSTLLPLVRLPLHVGQAAVSIHRSKDVRPAGRAVPILSVLGHPVLRPPEACELLGVQVQKHTRGLDLIAPGRESPGSKTERRLLPAVLRIRATVLLETPSLWAMAWWGQRCWRSFFTRSLSLSGVRLGLCLGLELRHPPRGNAGATCKRSLG